MAEVAATGPVQYSAAREAALDEMTRQSIPVEPVVLSIPDTKLRSFERAPEGLKTEFEQWMTHDVDRRIELVEDIGKRWNHPVELTRNMNFVIWLESVHPMGSKLVAGRAFNFMFGAKEVQTEKKKK